MRPARLHSSRVPLGLGLLLGLAVLAPLASAQAPADEVPAAPPPLRPAPPAIRPVRAPGATGVPDRIRKGLQMRPKRSAPDTATGAQDGPGQVRRPRPGPAGPALPEGDAPEPEAAPASAAPAAAAPAAPVRYLDPAGIPGGVKRPGSRGTWLDLIVFYLLAAGCVIFSLVMITRRSPLMAALSLLVVFLCLAGVYVYLKAPFMAAIQLIVYAGAIIVLFVFVILSMGTQEERSLKDLASEIAYYLAGFLLSGTAAVILVFGRDLKALIVFAVLQAATLLLYLRFLRYWLTRFLGTAAATFAVVQMLRVSVATKVFPGPLPADHGSPRAIGRSLYVENVFAFEALSLLLLAAIVAAVVIVRSRQDPAREQPPEPAKEQP